MVGMRTIFVCGPYSGNRIDQHINTMTAIDVGIAILQKGWFPFIPHLTHFVDRRAQDHKVHIPYRTYMVWDDIYLQLCDALMYIDGSPGANEEVTRARHLGKRIFYNLDEIPDARTDGVSMGIPINTLYLTDVKEFWKRRDAAWSLIRRQKTVSRWYSRRCALEGEAV